MDALSANPASIAVWTDAGRNDGAADVGLTSGSDGGIRITIDAANSAVSFVIVRWNTRLPASALILGDHWERGYGDLEWRGVVPERVLPWYALVHETATGATHGYGVETGAASLASWRIDEGGVSLVLDLRCGGVGVRLGARRLEAATIREAYSQPGENAFAFAHRFCALHCAKPRLPLQPCYGGNDWYFRYGAITEDTVRGDAGLIRDLSPSTNNAPCFVIDAGWYAGMSGAGGGPYDRGNAAFPDLPRLATDMREIGVRPGIWIRPLLTDESVPETWRVGTKHPLAEVSGKTLDPSIPEVLGLISADIRRLRDWGFEIIKHDFTTFDITGRWGFEFGAGISERGWSFADPTRTTAELIGGLYTAIREAAGDAALIGCNTIGHLGAGLFELQRTGDDTSGRHWERTRKMGVNTLAFRMPQHGAFFHADVDCVGLTKRIAWEQNKQWLDLVSRSGTPLFVSLDPDAIGPEQRSALREAFQRAARATVSAEPLDWLRTTCPRHWRFDGETRNYDWETSPGTSFDCPL